MENTEEDYNQCKARLITALKNNPMREHTIEREKKIVSKSMLSSLSIDEDFLAEDDKGFIYLIGENYEKDMQ